MTENETHEPILFQFLVTNENGMRPEEIYADSIEEAVEILHSRMDIETEDYTIVSGGESFSNFLDFIQNEDEIWAAFEEAYIGEAAPEPDFDALADTDIDDLDGPEIGGFYAAN